LAAPGPRGPTLLKQQCWLTIWRTVLTATPC
jgi:hypothetical protein